jgi:gas vesicle protein
LRYILAMENELYHQQIPDIKEPRQPDGVCTCGAATCEYWEYHLLQDRGSYLKKKPKKPNKKSKKLIIDDFNFNSLKLKELKLQKLKDLYNEKCDAYNKVSRTVMTELQEKKDQIREKIKRLEENNKGNGGDIKNLEKELNDLLQLNMADVIISIRNSIENDREELREAMKRVNGEIVALKGEGK